MKNCIHQLVSFFYQFPKRLFFVAPGNGRNANTTFPNISPPLCLSHDPLFSSLSPGQECKAAEGVSRQIPLLRTVFEQFPHIPINIDVKTGHPVLIRKISALIEEFNRVDITVWGSFSDSVNRECHLENPRIATFMPIKRTIKIVLAYYLGLLPFLSLSDGFFEVPLMRNFA